jgi:hypothetical protein
VDRKFCAANSLTALTCAAGAAAALLTGVAQAKTIMGSGAAGTCGMFVVDTDKLSQLSWAMGWLSRASLMHTGDMLAPIDRSGLQVWLENYCRANPLERFANAVEMLEAELAKRAAAPK